MDTFSILKNYAPALLAGLRTTGELCLIIWPTGLIIGTVLAIMAAHLPRSFGMVQRSVSFFFTSVPVIVLLVWLHFPAQMALGVVIDPFYTAAFALSAINVFAIADILRPALTAFPSGYLAAARVAGMKRDQIFRQIQLPMIVRQVLPAVLMAQVAMLQATIFASLISVDEIFRVTQRINSLIYRPVQIYTALALLFLVTCAPLNGIAIILANRYRLRLAID
jgi:polar amino acid transport system permease protein